MDTDLEKVVYHKKTGWDIFNIKAVEDIILLEFEKKIQSIFKKFVNLIIVKIKLRNYFLIIMIVLKVKLLLLL